MHTNTDKEVHTNTDKEVHTNTDKEVHTTKILKPILNLPRIRKCANVIPIHKKGDKSDPTNYRPVSLLATTGKMLEKIVFTYLFNHLRVNFSISPWQSGFMPGCSTICQLFEIYHTFCQGVENGKEVRVVFLDISRAFDRLTEYGMLVSCIN